ncbi:N-acetyl-alpha-D-glucosaminyl-diphospho-ditrans,octacis-undecaprenol 4-epimerase [Thauera sp. GDN1]|uniref:complex I NDUFA9 subunit family protein n=1 Tax=Thauera sp. GDN1 TaxID=2944810 RepID=UPI002478570F|nr:complex I NDUFA9 subunit family protein [Thauera sp. GDN1]WEN43617.1 N-acetyl-alpha-D-glucosaminyl-diphospho-ditrans,octacis-undecaprenol 4-epimerase [Thauera sp. GDN1]
MNPQRVVIVGGSGFIGSAIANRLCEAGIRVLIPTRRRSRAGHVLLLPNVEVVEADVHDPAVLANLFAGADAVINTVGVLHSRSGTPFGPDFARAHVELPQKIVAACRAAGVPGLVHISALGASIDGPSEYQRSKAAGELAIHAAGADIAWTILRPSVVFGRGDSFLNLFAGLARSLPVLPLAGAGCRFQPVYVEDVAEAVWQSLIRPQAAGQTFELAGPTVYTLRQLVEYVSALVGKPRPVVPLPEGIAMLQARLMEFAPQPLMSRDNVRSMRVDNVAHGDPLPFGLHPSALEAVAPAWLGEAGPRAFYYPFRRHARR